MDYQYNTAMPIARRLADILQPACQQLHIAGSLRRRKTTVHDIEIVCQPHIESATDLFGNILSDYTPQIDAILQDLTDAGDLVAIKGGPRYRQFAVQPLGIPLDLFIVIPPAQYGNILAIRTGPAHYSHWLVTRKQKGGALPSHLTARDGAIWENDRLFPAPTEADFYAILGIPVPDPPIREPAWGRSTP